MAGWLSRFRNERARIADGEALGRFVTARAAFVAQKAVMDHLNLVIGQSTLAQHAADPEVARALHHCRWEILAALLGDSAELAQIFLRHAGYAGSPLASVLRHVTEDAVEGMPGLATQMSWPAELDAVEAQLARSALAAPHVVHTLGGPATERMIASLPTAPQLEEGFREVILNSVRFNLCRAYADLEAQADAAALGEMLRLPRATG